MKKVAIFTFLLFAIKIINAQTIIPTANSATLKFVELYNALKFEELYAQLAPNFKQFVSQEQVTALLKEQVKATGNILSSKIILLDKNRVTYFLDGEKQDFIIQFNLTGGLIDGLFVTTETTVKDPISFKLKGTLKTSNPLTNVLDKKIDSVIKSFQEHTSLNGLSIGYLNNEKEYFYSYGNAIRGMEALPNSQSVFDVGSITKTFTAYILAALATENKLSLDAKLSAYFPDLASDVASITLTQLANHTSGLPNMGPPPLKRASGRDPHEQFSYEDMINYLSMVQLETAPGSRFLYSNLGFGVLGNILERAGEMSYEQLVNKYIITPNELKNTFLKGQLNTENKTLGVGKTGNDQDYIQLSAYAAAGNIKSTTEDLLKYSKLFLSEGSVAKLSTKLTFQPAQGNKVALGWIILPVSNKELLFHNGSVIGYNSFLAIDPISKKVLVLLANSNADMTLLGVSLMDILLNTPS